MYSLRKVLVTASVLFPVIRAIPYPFNEARTDTTYLYPREVEVAQELGPQLSKNASIFTSSSSQWKSVTERWQALTSPQFSLVVEPGVESDVAKIVRYANRRSIPFWAVNRAHSLGTAAAQIRNGIAIRMTTLDAIVVSKDRNSAHMQGGVYGAPVMQKLWDIGYVTTTGSCDCVGLLGPALGGGMGRYEGFYGLVSDNIISMNVVLADGSEVKVSPTSNNDLWWAMRGAGHNFGIVTSFDLKIYPRSSDAWWYGTYLYTGNQLEDLIKVTNAMTKNGTTPKELMYFGVMTVIPAIDPKNPTLIWTIYYVGSQKQAEPYVKPFLDLGPFSIKNDSVPYPEIPDATGTGRNTPVCEDGLSRIYGPVGLQTINAIASRSVYNSLRDFVGTNLVYNRTAVLFEGYSTVGVHAQPAADSAYPHREENLMTSITTEYAYNPSLDAAAWKWTREATQILRNGQPDRKPSTYVNYAMSDEPLEQIYGYEPWRLQRLKSLKAKYDPNNRFRYYVPIIRS